MSHIRKLVDEATDEAIAETFWEYQAFIEKLAQKELHVTPNDLLDMLPKWYACPYCVALSPIGIATHVTTPETFVHADDCPVVEARRLLGWPMTEGGELLSPSGENNRESENG